MHDPHDITIGALVSVALLGITGLVPSVITAALLGVLALKAFVAAYVWALRGTVPAKRRDDALVGWLKRDLPSPRALVDAEAARAFAARITDDMPDLRPTVAAYLADINQTGEAFAAAADTDTAEREAVRRIWRCARWAHLTLEDDPHCVVCGSDRGGREFPTMTRLAKYARLHVSNVANRERRRLADERSFCAEHGHVYVVGDARCVKCGHGYTVSDGMADYDAHGLGARFPV